jgi:Outer membrane protein beta-barrel domain
MRKALFLVSFLLFSTGLFAQSNLTIGIHSGVLFSAFEDQDKTLTAIPAGGYFGVEVNENMEIGAEVNLTVKNFEDSQDGITASMSQTIIGAYLRYYFPAETVVPYIRAGVGYYLGAVEFSGENYPDFLTNNFDYKGAVGFNIGAGIGTESGLYAEFIYHIVDQEIDTDLFETDAAGANNFGAHIGYSFSIN